MDDADLFVEGRPESDAENGVQAVEAAASRKKGNQVCPLRPPQCDSQAGDSDNDRAPKPRKHATKRPPSPAASYSSNDGSRPHSRHKPVANSAIYKTYEGTVLSDTRRRFQTLIMIRDGFPLKSLYIHRALNFKLSLVAAKDVLEKRTYTEFKNARENARRDTSEESVPAMFFFKA